MDNSDNTPLKEESKPIEEQLTGKQEKFCREYLVDYNATRAAKEAGYSHNAAQEIGCENLRKPLIKTYLEYLKNNLAELSGVSALKNLEVLTEIRDANGAKSKDKGKVAAKARNRDRTKAIEVINKMCGFNAPDVSQVNIPPGVNVITAIEIIKPKNND